MKNPLQEKKDSGTLTSQLKKGLQTLKQEKKQIQRFSKTLSLLDVSGSMGETVGNERKIDSLRKAIASLPSSARKYVFSSNCFPVEIIPEPQSNTNLAGAFETISSETMNRVILVSDGMPDNPESAISFAKRLQIPVDVLFIGEGESSGEKFMRELSHTTGGKEITIITKNISPDQNISGMIEDNIKSLVWDG